MSAKQQTWVLPSRLDLLQTLATDGRASCREFAREMLVAGRKWIEEQTYLGTLTNREKVKNGIPVA